MDVNTEQPAPLINPTDACQTLHRSFPRHYWVAVWEGGSDTALGALTNRQRCTTCGVVEDARRFEGQ